MGAINLAERHNFSPSQFIADDGIITTMKKKKGETNTIISCFSSGQTTTAKHKRNVFLRRGKRGCRRISADWKFAFVKKEKKIGVNSF